MPTRTWPLCQGAFSPSPKSAGTLVLDLPQILFSQYDESLDFSLRYAIAPLSGFARVLPGETTPLLELNRDDLLGVLLQFLTAADTAG